MTLVIVDTGCANLASVQYAFERLGAYPLVSDQAEQIKNASKVVIPGVGSAPFAMKSIDNKGLRPILQSLEQPVIGICLGMQLLFETLEEGGETVEGLNLVPGKIASLDTGDLPSPHIGWNTLSSVADDPLLKDVSNGDHAYFVHSYAAAVTDNTLARSEYGAEFTAIIRKDNVWGCQFHPERSSKTGAQILKNFMDLTL